MLTNPQKDQGCGANSRVNLLGTGKTTNNMRKFEEDDKNSIFIVHSQEKWNVYSLVKDPTTWEK